MKSSHLSIEKIKAKLDEAEATDFIYLTKPVQQLRHHALYLHTTFEASIDKIIIKHILKDVNLGPQQVREKVTLHHKLRIILNEIDFAKKVKIVEKQKSLPQEVIGKLFAVNDIRVHFAHPTTYRAKLISYQETEKLHSAYKILNDALESLKEAGVDDRPIILSLP